LVSFSKASRSWWERAFCSTERIPTQRSRFLLLIALVCLSEVAIAQKARVSRTRISEPRSQFIKSNLVIISASGWLDRLTRSLAARTYDDNKGNTIVNGSDNLYRRDSVVPENRFHRGVRLRHIENKIS
jgi:hypothetical protein